MGLGLGLQIWLGKALCFDQRRNNKMQVYILLFSALNKCSCLAGETEIAEEDTIKNSKQHKQESVTSDKESVTSDKESVTSDKESVTSDKESVTSDKESATSDDDSIESILRTVTRVPREVVHILPEAESAPELPIR